MSGYSAREQVLFLARAESRVRILEALSAADPATQRELRSRLESSRTTVSRALSSLTERGWVEETGGAYRLTHAGALIAAEFGRTLETVDRVGNLAEFLRWFPPDIELPDLLDASDVKVTYSTDAAPYAPARKQSDILHGADRLRILLPATDLESTEAIAEQVTEHGLEVETVVSPGVEATLELDAFKPHIRAMVRTRRSRIFVTEEFLPFYLGLAADGRVQVGLADDDGLPRALLETEDAGIRRWAEGVYRTYRAGARPKPAEEF